MTTTANGSLWLQTGPTVASDPRPDDGTRVQTCVVGGGIVGITLALAQARRGRSVLLLERDRIGGGVTGCTTGKATLLHSLRYADLYDRHDPRRMAAYVDLQRAGLAHMRERAADIPGAWADRDAVTYVRDPQRAGDVEREGEALTGLGVGVRSAGSIDIGDELAAGLVLADQGRMHTVRYTARIAEQARDAGAILVTGAPVVALRRGDGGHRVVLPDGTSITAEHVAVCTHAPIFDRAAHFALQEAVRSYAIAVPVAREPAEMTYCDGDPVRSVMGHTDDDGAFAVVGGEGHAAGRSADAGRFERLQAWAADRLDTDEPARYRWSSQDLISVDGLPLVGAYAPGVRRLWTATGFAKWGLAAGAGAALALDAAIVGEGSPATDLLRPWRPALRAGIGAFVANNLTVQRHLVGDRLHTLARGGTADAALDPGDGRIERIGGARSPSRAMPRGRCTDARQRARTSAARSASTPTSAAGTVRATAPGSRWTVPCWRALPCVRSRRRPATAPSGRAGRR